MRLTHEPGALPDLDLLRMFLAVHHARHLTRAADAIGRSQPAMSRALARMRDAFDDELFVRTPRGLVPTARADVIATEAAELLARAHALVRPERFDPARLSRCFVVATSDLVEQELVASVVALLAAEAPGVDVTFRPVTGDVEGDLASGRTDLLFAPRAGLSPELVTRHLFDDGFLCAARRDHPALRRGLTLELYARLGHVQIAPRGLPGGPVDDVLATRGLARRVAVRTPSFLAAPLLAARSDLLLTAPSRVLVPLAAQFGLRLHDPPIAIPGFAMHQVFHPRAAADPAHRWFRELIERAVRPAPSRRTRRSRAEPGRGGGEGGRGGERPRLDPPRAAR